MAEKFGIKTIAEWVQTEEDADYLRQWGVDYLQGNQFGSASMVLPWETAAAKRNRRNRKQCSVAGAPASEPPLQPNLESPGLDRLREAIATLDKTSTGR